MTFACHADQALALLDDPFPDERRALGAVRFQDNHMMLQADPRVMPLCRRCWSAWIYRTEADDQTSFRARVFDRAALQAQASVAQMQGTRRL